MRILDYDPLSKEYTSFQYDELNDDVIIGYHQDIENVLEYNKALANDADYSKRGMKESWWHYAKVPNLVQMKMKMEKGIDFHEPSHAPAVFRYLNDPENKYLRTTSKLHWPKKT
jgi:hypothetical protein